MEEFGSRIQSLMDEFYNEWQKEENKNKDKWEVLGNLSEAHQIAVAFGNFNYQVENGGIHQWIYNGYFHDDSEKLTAYLESGAGLDERCQKILDTIYKLDQCAQDTDCGRDGHYTEPDDEDSEWQFIGDMIDCNAFDTWYYEHCDGDDWWKTVCGVIEKVTGHEFTPTGQEVSAEALAENSDITNTANIANVINGELRVGDIVVSHSANELSFLVGIVRSINKHGSPEHDTGNADDDIYVDFSANEYTPRRVSEIEFAFRKAYGEMREFDDLPLDEVIMGPDMLIRANNLDLTSRDEMYGILESDEGALDYCNRILSAHGLHIDGLDADVAPMPQAEKTSELMDAKLYSPVFIDFWADTDTYHDHPEGLSQTSAAREIEKIQVAVIGNRSEEEAARGLMEYFHSDSSIEPLSVDGKVKSLFVDVEAHDGKLWAVASLKITEPLNADDLGDLCNYLEGQYSDGWGEGLSQQFVKIEDGEVNIHLWKHGEFFLDTQEQFAQRLGIDLPADALSLPAPDPAANIPVADSKPIVTPLDQLKERLDTNFADYLESIKSLEGVALTQISSRVAVMAEAHNYLTGDNYKFEESELDYLLQFKNPLELMADEFEERGVPEGLRDTEMWRIFDRREHDGYELVADSAKTLGIHDSITIPVALGVPAVAITSEVAAPSFDEKLETFLGRLKGNFEDYKDDVTNLDKEGIFWDAPEIASTQKTFDFFNDEHKYTTEQLDFLLKFQDPLGFLTDSFSLGIGDANMVSDMATFTFSEANMERVLSSGSYEIVSDDPETPPTTVSTQDKTVKTAGAGDKPSVVDEIRQHQQKTQERPTMPKEKDNDLSARKKSDPDL